jgi:16S rRNA (adenine1518-N6/adenine1519-N6)-dimethyltransferase
MKLADSLELNNFLRENKLKPDHALGQNFLVDEKVLTKIVDAAELQSSDEVIEIGAGLGTLTQELASRAHKVTALEFDAKIFPKLTENLKAYGNVKLQNLDVRKFTPPKTSYKLVANIPYYLTSPILRQFFVESGNPPQIAVLLVQKEVAKKICDPKKLSVLSLEVKLFAEPEIIEIVKPKSFLPPPKVDSAILKLRLKEKFAVEQNDLPDFFKIIHAGFSAPRKKIRGSFAKGFAGKKEVADEILKTAGIDLDLRPEDLGIGEWKRIFNNVKRRT